MRSKIKLEGGDVWKQTRPLTYLLVRDGLSAGHKELPYFLAVLLVFLEKGDGVKVVLVGIIQIDALVQVRIAYNLVPSLACTAGNKQILLVQIRHNENKRFYWQFVHDAVDV